MSGFTYPYGTDRQGCTASPTEEEAVNQLIELVLFTAPGERVHRPTFGSGVYQLVFAANSAELATATQYRIQAALQQYLSDRVRLEQVAVDADDNVLQVSVAYTLRYSTDRKIAVFRREV